MGRVIKNAPAADESYIVAPPPLLASANGQSWLEDPDGFADIAEAPPEADPLPPVPIVPAIDWDALHREAAEIIDGASADAETIVTEARDKAKAIVESARHGIASVTTTAREGGERDGHAEGVQKADREMDEMLGTMRGLVDMARVERHKIVEGAEPEIVKLAMGIAERILHKAVELDREIVVAMTKAAVGQLVDRESITVRVNPIDLERMKVHRDSVLALGETKHMRVIEDNRVDPGGVVVETEAGTLDAKVATQVQEAKRVLNLGNEEIVVEPPAESPLSQLPKAETAHAS